MLQREAASCRLPASCLERDHSKSGAAIEAGAGFQGQPPARGCGPPKTNSSSTINDNWPVQAGSREADCARGEGGPKRRLLEAAFRAQICQ
ncbi:guanine nucleotide-binding protein G(I)/G(S)/G(O) subunit gamma-2 isoform X1 [Leopardus geoffroyi]|uniref:guanine nucleotide-binding protein G(I)/G(S)/G(O) subunit gamma-2 isoform X1 n=1 Tax=Leopardus geoffroyi TaxID=46844 RepID=UPI001E2633CE|nr:guanine nucleotide-binding protein G(I)/G(S)/G(O) subunit gamma-2 isoform X1 [Leopardus geoffroyi]